MSGPKLGGYLAAEARIAEQNRQVALERSPAVSSFFNLDHIQNQPASIGPQPSLAQSFDQGYEQQYRVDSPYSLEAELQQGWMDSLEALHQKTGMDVTKFENSWGGYGQYAKELKGQEQSFWNRDFGGGVAPDVQAQIDEFKKADAEIAKLKDPNIHQFKDILDEVEQLQQQVEAKTAKVSASQGGLGTLAQFAGSMVGSFTSRDPVNLATLGIGGFGRSIATKMATEALVGGSLAAITDWGSVNPARETVGLPQHSVVQDALFAAAGAGLLTGGLEAAGRAIGHFRGGPEITPEMRDAAVRSILEAQGKSPTARAGLDLLDMQHDIERASPYGDSHAGQTRFLAEITDLQKTLGGAPETAVARFLPPVPIEDLERAADFEIVKEEAPDIWGRVQAAEERVNSITQRLSNLEDKTLFVHGGSDFTELDARFQGSGEPGGIRPLGDGLYGYAVKGNDTKGLLEAIKGARTYADKYGKGNKAIHIFEADIANSQVRFNGQHVAGFEGQPLPEAEQAALNAYGEANKLPPGPERHAAFDRARELDKLAGPPDYHFKGEQLPGGLVEMAARDLSKLTPVAKGGLNLSDAALAKLAIPTKTELKTANKAYREAVQEAERAREALNNIERIKTAAANKKTVDLLGTSMQGRSLIGPLLRHDVVEAHMESLGHLAETQDDRALTSIHALTSPEGMVDIGLSKPVPENFTFMTEGGDVTVRQILDDLIADEALDEAMRTCSI